MDAQEQIRRFQEFFENNYQSVLLDKVSRNEEFIVVLFQDLAMFDIQLAEELLEKPEDTIKAAEYAISKFDLGVDDFKMFVRFADLPESSHLQIRHVRSKHIEKLFQFQGIVRQKSDVRPQVTNARFECPSCGNIISILQVDTKFREPSGCSCGRKGKFHLVSKELVDAQKIVLEEAPEGLDGGEQPKRINVFLKNDLVSPMSDKKTNPGSKITVVGTLKEVPIVLATGGKSTRFDLMFEANYVEPVQEEFETLVISDEQKEEIMSISKDPQVYEKLISSIAPSIYGHERIKEALLLQLFGGESKLQDDGVRRRGDIHVLLIGDPGSGKCASGNTKILLKTGEIKTLKEMSENKTFLEEYSSLKETGICSLNFDGKIYSGEANKIWKRKNSKKLILIKLRSGKKLTITKEHPLFCSSSGLIVAKSAKDFKVGEHIASPREICIFGETQFLSSFKSKKYSNNSKKYKYPVILDKNLARLLGYLCGDGHLKYTRTSGCLSITNEEKNILKDAKKIFLHNFNVRMSVRKKKNSNTEEIYTFSKSLLDYFSVFFSEILCKSNKKDLPQRIQKSPDVILSEFIKALFDCDAHVNVKKKQIEYTTTSRELAENIQISLLRFGIVAFLKIKEKHATNTKEKRKIKAYELIFSGEFLRNYAGKIGFTSTHKEKALTSILKRKMNTNVDIVPNTKYLLLNIRKEFKLTQNEMGIPRGTYAHYEQENRLPSTQSLKKIVSHLIFNKHVSDNVVKLYKLAHSDVFWDEIISIDEISSKEEYVYDLEVKNTHNYVANGVIIHNSQLLKRLSIVAPKARFVSGKGASGAGLTASVVRDEFLRGWALEAGALVLANKGLVCIDELDKMSKEDTSAMHEALEQQQVSISKANIQATLRSETTVLAAANPKFGRFDPYEILVKQIELPSTLINRFDLIFPVKDLPDKEKDEKLASFVLKLHKGSDIIVPDYATDLIKRYVAYAKQNIHPKLTEPALNEIKRYFVSMRNSGSSEDKVQTIPISARQLEGLVRLSEASAKTRLSNSVTKKDAQKAIDLMHHCLTLIGLDTETGKFDIDRIATGITASQRGNIHKLKEIINELENAVGKQIPVEDIIREAEIRNIPEETTNEVLEKLKRGGDLFMPKHGFVSKI